MPKARTSANSKPGRPTLFSPEIAALVCDRLAAGESLRAICRNAAMPDERTVRRWVATGYEGFPAQYAHAREMQAHTIADELLEIADDGANDTYVDDEGNRRTDHDVIARSRLRVDTRKWLLSKMLPKTYGDKQALEHSGPDGSALFPAVRVVFGDE